MKKFRTYRRDEKGSTSTVMALAFPVIVGSFILIMEVGYWHLAKNDLQNTADMAALAGARHYVITDSKPEAKNASVADARDNHFETSIGTMTVNIPPASGAYAGKKAVQVQIEQEVPTFLVHMFKSDPIMANVNAVAILKSEVLPACVIALSDSHTGISIGGNVDVKLEGCVLHSNSSDSEAIKHFGSAELEADCTSSVGGQSLTADYTFKKCDTGHESQSVLADPFADVDIPENLEDLPCGSVTTSGKGNKKKTTMPNPGGGISRICGDVNLHGDVNLAPGTYVFDGADLDFASKAELSGNGVTIIFANGGGLGTINNNNAIDLTAPSSGDYAGMVMMSDRDTTGLQTWTINGQADVSLNGAVYFPTVNLYYAGGAGSLATGCTQLVVNRVSFRGNSGFESDCSDLGLSDIDVDFATEFVQLVE